MAPTTLGLGFANFESNITDLRVTAPFGHSDHGVIPITNKWKSRGLRKNREYHVRTPA